MISPGVCLIVVVALALSDANGNETAEETLCTRNFSNSPRPQFATCRYDGVCGGAKPAYHLTTDRDVDHFLDLFVRFNDLVVQYSSSGDGGSAVVTGNGQVVMFGSVFGKCKPCYCSEAAEKHCVPLNDVQNETCAGGYLVPLWPRALGDLCVRFGAPLVPSTAIAELSPLQRVVSVNGLLSTYDLGFYQTQSSANADHLVAFALQAKLGMVYKAAFFFACGPLGIFNIRSEGYVTAGQAAYRAGPPTTTTTTTSSMVSLPSQAYTLRVNDDSVVSQSRFLATAATAAAVPPSHTAVPDWLVAVIVLIVAAFLILCIMVMATFVFAGRLVRRFADPAVLRSESGVAMQHFNQQSSAKNGVRDSYSSESSTTSSAPIKPDSSSSRPIPPTSRL